MDPSTKVEYIKEITKNLENEDWPVIDMTLRQFRVFTTVYGSHNKHSYIIKMLDEADDESISMLYSHLIKKSEKYDQIDNIDSWLPGYFRLFISHASENKIIATSLDCELKKFYISGFIAHKDIKPTKKWQDEIHAALNTADVLIAILTQQFRQSIWTDQEVGIAIGRKILIIPIIFGIDPYGFIGKFQGLPGNGKNYSQLANEIFDIFVNHEMTKKRIAEVVTNMFEKSQSFQKAKYNISLLERIQYCNKTIIERISSAVENNFQISKSFGVPERTKSLIEKFQQKMKVIL